MAHETGKELLDLRCILSSRGGLREEVSVLRQEKETDKRKKRVKRPMRKREGRTVTLAYEMGEVRNSSAVSMA